MTKIFPWIIMVIVIFSIISHLNPQLIDDIKRRVTEKTENITQLNSNIKSKEIINNQETKIKIWNPFKSKEIDTRSKDCRAQALSLTGALYVIAVESDCTNICQVEGYSYKQWKCSEQDTLVCVCN